MQQNTDIHAPNIKRLHGIGALRYAVCVTKRSGVTKCCKTTLYVVKKQAKHQKNGFGAWLNEIKAINL